MCVLCVCKPASVEHCKQCGAAWGFPCLLTPSGIPSPLPRPWTTSLNSCLFRIPSPPTPSILYPLPTHTFPHTPQDVAQQVSELSDHLHLGGFNTADKVDHVLTWINSQKDAVSGLAGANSSCLVLC